MLGYRPKHTLMSLRMTFLCCSILFLLLHFIIRPALSHPIRTQDDYSVWFEILILLNGYIIPILFVLIPIATTLRSMQQITRHNLSTGHALLRQDGIKGPEMVWAYIFVTLFPLRNLILWILGSVTIFWFEVDLITNSAYGTCAALTCRISTDGRIVFIILVGFLLLGLIFMGAAIGLYVALRWKKLFWITISTQVLITLFTNIFAFSRLSFLYISIKQRESILPFLILIVLPFLLGVCILYGAARWDVKTPELQLFGNNGRK
jgi:hypothetical protein